MNIKKFYASDPLQGGSGSRNLQAARFRGDYGLPALSDLRWLKVTATKNSEFKSQDSGRKRKEIYLCSV